MRQYGIGSCDCCADLLSALNYGGTSPQGTLCALGYWLLPFQG